MTPRNIRELQNQLIETVEQLKRDPRYYNQAREIGNLAGKILVCSKLELDYAVARGEQPIIPFLGETSGIPIKQVKQLPPI